METEECFVDTMPQGRTGGWEQVMEEENKRFDPGEKERFLALYMGATDEQLCRHLRSIAAHLGRLPTKEDVPAFDYIKKRLGPWPRVLERAGLKEISDRRRAMLENKERLKRMKKKRKHRGKCFREGEGL